MLLFLALACHEAPEAPPQHTEPSPEITTSSTTTGVEGARVARLSHVQWHLTTTDLLYLDGADDLTTDFVESATPSWFENDRTALMVDPTLWMQYQAASEELAGTVANDPELLRRVAPIPDRDTFIEGFGLRAFRRPLTNAEKAAFASVFDEGSSIFGTGDPFADGVHAAIAAFLQSPWFIYRGLGFAGPGDGTELESYELASKLSYALWNTMPDQELFDAAAQGLTPERVEEQARRMLEHPKAAAMVADLHRQWLNIDTYQNMYRTHDERYDDYENSTPYAMTKELYAYIDRVAYGGGTVEDLFTSRETIAEWRLAAVYGIEGLEKVQTPDMVPVTLDPDERSGLLTLSGFLAWKSDGFTEDLINRGSFINHQILCVDIPVPAVTVPPLPVDEGNLTLRERVEDHTSTCGGTCHNDYINPVGFAFGIYDAGGRYQLAYDDGRPIDASGTYPFDDGDHTFVDAVDLSEQLAVNPMTHRCYSSRLLAFAEGRKITHDDDAYLDELMYESMAGKPIRELMFDIVTSERFRLRPEAAAEIPATTL